MKNTRVENATDDIELERKGCLVYTVYGLSCITN